jgi:SAM-dependent methyltransferase
MTLALPVTSCSDHGRESPSGDPVRARATFSCVELLATMTDARAARRLNRAHWDALAALHGHDAVYDEEALVAGADCLGDREAAGVREAVGAVAGLDVVHVQCHIGFDTISLARRGARVTGVDFSRVAVERARELARRCGVEAEFVEGDATDLPRELHGRFDLAFATVGVTSWIEDIGAWMRSVAAVLRPGGRLLLIDLHPLFMMFDSVDPLVLDFPYAFDGGRAFDEDGSYADASLHVGATQTVEYAHSLGEIVNAAVAAGLRIERLEEHLDAERDPRGGVLAREQDDRYRLRLSGEILPLSYTLIARRP